MTKSVSVLILTLFIGLQLHASKARIGSLQGADHLIDTQTVLKNPAHINSLTPFLTFEMGGVGSGAEGGISKKLSNGNLLGIYLGHNNTSTRRDGSIFLEQQNPVEVIYGVGNQGYAASLSTVDNKRSGTKETTVVLKYGITGDSWDYFGHLTLISSAEKTGTPDQKINDAPRLTLGASKKTGTDHCFARLDYGNAKTEAGTVSTTTKDLGLILGWEDRSLKVTDKDIYYGFQFEYGSTDIEGEKISTTALPVFVGLEMNMNSWSVFRASLKQNVLIGSKKDETAANTDPEGINNNTTVAAGLGLKHSNLTLDGILSASTTGQINGTAFLVSTAVTYNF